MNDRPLSACRDNTGRDIHFTNVTIIFEITCSPGDIYANLLEMPQIFCYSRISLRIEVML